MRRVYKYTLEMSSDEQVLSLPAGARLLRVDAQYGQPRLWALVEIGADREDRRLLIRGTGELVGDVRHISTFFMDGARVFHAFEVLNA